MSMEKKIGQRDFYKSLPKVELHRHLEGSLRLSTMIEIAHLHNLDLPYKDVSKFRSLVQIVKSDPLNFQNFLSKFATLRQFYQSPEAIKRITYEVIADAASDNIRYMEMRFTPVALTRIKEYPLADAMDWVIEAVDEASNEYGIKTRLIASVNRHESVKLAEEVMQLAVDRQGRGIVGMDLAGSEAEYPGGEFEPVFREASDSGLKITIHAGEWGGPEIIRLAINILRAERIGHGVRVVEDKNVSVLAREKQIAFEVCPTSNFQSGVVETLHQHPLPRMMEEGLLCTINTDDPGISQIDLSDEYEIVNKVMGITGDGLKALTMNAVQCAFLPESEKQILIDDLHKEYLGIFPG